MTTNPANIFANGIKSRAATEPRSADNSAKKSADNCAINSAINSADKVDGRNGALLFRAAQRTSRTNVAHSSDAATSSPVRLLLIEDDVRLAQLVRDYLTQENFQIAVEHRGDTALENFDPSAVDIVVLDLMLPGLDGLKVCSGLRKIFSGPILILTAKSSDIDHVMGLELGADDFVHKPIEPPVLLARLRALLRRTQRAVGDNAQLSSDMLVFGKLSINLRAHQVKLGDDIIDFTTQEFELLHFLASNDGKVLSRDDIFNNIRGIEYDGLDRTVDVRISRLRKKLNDSSSQPRRIKTVWGKGYLFVGDAWS